MASHRFKESKGVAFELIYAPDVNQASRNGEEIDQCGSVGARGRVCGCKRVSPVRPCLAVVATEVRVSGGGIYR